MSPPAGSQSATSSGPGQDRASAHVDVVTPGAALPDATTVSTRSPPCRQQDERKVAGGGQLGHRRSVGFAGPAHRRPSPGSSGSSAPPRRPSPRPAGRASRSWRRSRWSSPSLPGVGTMSTCCPGVNPRAGNCPSFKGSATSSSPAARPLPVPTWARVSSSPRVSGTCATIPTTWDCCGCRDGRQVGVRGNVRDRQVVGCDRRAHLHVPGDGEHRGRGRSASGRRRRRSGHRAGRRAR